MNSNPPTPSSDRSAAPVVPPVPVVPAIPVPPPLEPLAPLSQRIWKGFGSTPWWRLILGGLIVLISVALFTVPFDSIRLQQVLKTPAARQELKFAVQKQVLERARSGLIGFRAISDDPSAVKEIDDAISDIERELGTPRQAIVVKNAAELKALIETQRDDIKKNSRALEQLAAKLRANADASDAGSNVDQLSDKLDTLQESVEQLQEMQSRAREFDASAGRPDNKDGKNDTTITFNLFGKKGQAVVNLSDRPVTEPINLDPATRELIQSTVRRDAEKLIIGSVTFVALLTLFLLMLIARAFAGRAARGEQRAVIAESRERSESYARQLAEARLMVMRAQVEPHFLFNTLAHVQALQEIDPPQAGVMLERLISYLRAAMPTMRETTSTLGREVEVVRAYLDLLKIRMGDRLNYTINVPAELNNISFPPTMIATLVENAIKHGLEPKREGGTVAIQVRTVGDQIEVLIADNGLGLGGAQTQGSGVGLANTRERLKMLYGDTGELVVEPNAPTGVRALLRVPKVPPAMVSGESGIDESNDVSKFTMQTVGLLCLFTGWLGVHRMYVGRARSGAGQTVLGALTILSGGVPVFWVPLLMWLVLDLVRLVTREFTDGRGLRIVRVNSEDQRVYRGYHAVQTTKRERSPGVSDCSRSIAMILVLLLGLVGGHRFYVGRVGTAFAMLFSLGGLGIWWLIDVVIVASGQLKDSDGKRVSEWE